MKHHCHRRTQTHITASNVLFCSGGQQKTVGQREEGMAASEGGNEWKKERWRDEKENRGGVVVMDR